MSWKNGNIFRFKSLSLVTKLMLFYSISTIGLLSAICLCLYPTFIKIMDELNKRHAAHMSATCYKNVIITLLISSLTAIIFGHLIARKGLTRLQEFENTLEKITVDSLHERINLSEWPIELTSLGHKFNTMLDRIQTGFIQLNQFSSDIAHELRTPIHNLIGITELELTKQDHAERYQILLEKYMSEYQHLAKLIENLLFFARSEQGQLTLKKEVIDAQKEINHICDYYQPFLDEKNIALRCEGSAKIMADRTLFRRLISNVLSNALRHTNLEGSIHIFIASMPQLVKIAFQDNGIGIDESHLAKVCDRFYRVDGARTTVTGELGLGLAMVKSIVELHQGKLVIESELNTGTCVSIHLPTA